jgi:AraC-like DNA-binding protein
MSFILKDGFIRPYAGIGFEKKDHSAFNIQPYNRISINVSSHNIKPFFVYLIYNDPSIKTDEKLTPSRYLCHYIEICSEQKRFNLKTKEFYTPDWWFDKYNLSPASTGKPKLNQIYRLAIVTGLTPRQNQEQSIQINSIIFYCDNTLVVSIMAIIQLVTVGITFLFYYIKTKPKKKLITISYNALPSKRIEKTQINFLDYIHENYHNSDLNLNIISKKTGVHIRKIAESISSQFNCNVKTYINQIRINEAKRLLNESTFNRSEIAYRVGFSSPSNFNRVFKNLTGISPSEYLQNTNS